MFSPGRDQRAARRNRRTPTAEEHDSTIASELPADDRGDEIWIGEGCEEQARVRRWRGFPPPSLRPTPGRARRGEAGGDAALGPKLSARQLRTSPALAGTARRRAGTPGEPLVRPVKSPALPTQVRILSLPPGSAAEIQQCNSGTCAPPPGFLSASIRFYPFDGACLAAGRSAWPGWTSSSGKGVWRRSASSCW
jgi:hypothetical protein